MSSRFKLNFFHIEDLKLQNQMPTQHTLKPVPTQIHISIAHLPENENEYRSVPILIYKFS